MASFHLQNYPNEQLLIGSLVNRSAELYYSYGDCASRCNHPSGACNDSFIRKYNCENCSVNNVFSSKTSCNGCCLECSEEVHYRQSWRGKAFRTEYDCQKLIYYYVCRYSWKYCSEIMYALENIELSKCGSYSILSLGCGQAPDLMAFEQINQIGGKSISYVGYDNNPYWEPVHEEIKTYCHAVNNIYCHFETIDVLDALQQYTGGFANVIVMSYLLSSFPDSERYKKADTLFDLLISKVLPYRNGEHVFIIVNDIDHNKKVRDYFDLFVKKLGSAGYHGKQQRRHFNDRKSDYGDRSVKYDNCSNKFTIPNQVNNDFNCAIRCSSAQCIIEVK